MDAAVGLSCVAYPTYAVLTLGAVLGEGDTGFHDATFGFYFITWGMPAFLIAWLFLLAWKVRPVWLFGAIAVATLIFLAYANIGRNHLFL
jgi:hypothetical protein